MYFFSNRVNPFPKIKVNMFQEFLQKKLHNMEKHLKTLEKN